MTAICRSITNCFHFCTSQTPQAKVDRNLFLTNQILKVTKAVERIGERIHIGTRHAYFLGGFAALFNPHAASVALLAIAANECRIYYQNKTAPYSTDPNKSVHGNLEKFVGQLLEEYSNRNRHKALLVLGKLEKQFETLDKREISLADKFTLVAMRELITKSGPSGYEKLLFLQIWLHGLNDKTKVFWDRLKTFYLKNGINSPARAIFENWINNWEVAFDCVYERNSVSIPNLSEEKYLYYLDRFLHGLEKAEPDPNPDKALQRIDFQYQIMTQFFNFYKDHKQNFFFSGKLFEDYLVGGAKKILSMHQRINREISEELSVSVE